MNFSHLQPNLHNVKRTAAGITARCPAHSDHRNSLSITDGGDKLLLKCHAGCTSESVCNALGISLSDLFADKPSITGKRRAEVVATYDYANESGQLEYQIRRDDQKSFKVWHRKNDKWVLGLNGQRRVLYRLEEVIAAETVYVVEGEKDADNMAANGFVATCNPFGAGKWRTDYNESLRDKIVIIIPDNDEPGQRHGLEVANHLNGIAKEIVIIELPGVKDITEYFEAGNTPDDLIEIVARAETWKPVPPPPKPLTAFTIKSANECVRDANKRPRARKVYGELVMEGELTIIFGSTGTGKSTFAVQVGDRAASGISDEHFSVETGPLRVLYVDFELSDRQFAARYSIKGDDGFNCDSYVWSENFFRAEIDSKNYDPSNYESLSTYMAEQIQVAVEMYKAQLLIVDNITWLKEGTETAKDALPLMKSLKRLKDAHELTVIALAHTPKRDAARALSINDLQGSMMLGNFADAVTAIGQSAKDKSVRYIKQIKVRTEEKQFDADNVAVFQNIKPDSFLKFDFLRFGYEREHLNTLTDAGRDEVTQQAKVYAQKGFSQRKIAAELGISLGAVNKYLRS